VYFLGELLLILLLTTGSTQVHAGLFVQERILDPLHLGVRLDHLGKEIRGPHVGYSGLVELQNGGFGTPQGSCVKCSFSLEVILSVIHIQRPSTQEIEFFDPGN
jgi:hypothetical protein